MEINYSRENINQIIGNNIRYIRKSNRLSQEKFAEQVDLSPQFVSDVERGIEGICLITAIKICNAMSCSPLVLFANLIEFENFNNEMDKFTKLSDKNKLILEPNISPIISPIQNIFTPFKTKNTSLSVKKQIKM